MTRHERRRRAARRRRIKGLVVLGVLSAVAFVCVGFGIGAEADEAVADMRDPITKPARYIVEIERETTRELDLCGPGTGKAEETVAEPDEPYTEADVIALAKMAYGEAFITRSDTEMSACMWCALNRLDSGNRFYDGCESVYDIVTQKNQFYGYDEGNPVDEHLAWLARDVLTRWVDEHNGATDVGRTLPREYCFFTGDGWHNSFTTEHQGGVEYDWSLSTPYES